MAEITDEQLARRAKLATPILQTIAYAEGHIADQREAMRAEAAALPAMAAARCASIAFELEILAKRYRRLGETFRKGY